MDTNRIKKATQWFYSNVFHDEAITPRHHTPAEKLPMLLRTARSLENSPGNPWQSRESVFYKQARLLVSYDDDYAYTGSVVRYFPTYEALTDQELRGYFSWRTKIRKGDVQKTSLTFAFLYIYELINGIGVSDPVEGFEKLRAFRDVYGPLDSGILRYLSQWMIDYAVYYNLDANMLADSPQVVFDRSIGILAQIRDQDEKALSDALKILAPKWLSRSKFYRAYRTDCDSVILRVLRRVSNHYATRTKKTMTQQFFGIRRQYQLRLFETAVFCDPLKPRNREYALDEYCVYHCEKGLWTVTKYPCSLRPNEKLENLMKTIDAVMREEYGYKHPVKYEIETKWLIRLIHDEAQALLQEKEAAEAKKMITIDYSQLSRIRREAAVTQERLTVDEEPDIQEPVPQRPVPAPDNSVVPDSPLSCTEYRLLHCLLYGGSTDWIRQEGHILSVLLDSINDKLYDVFLDTVLDDGPGICEDYIDELKEMVHP